MATKPNWRTMAPKIIYGARHLSPASHFERQFLRSCSTYPRVEHLMKPDPPFSNEV